DGGEVAARRGGGPRGDGVFLRNLANKFVLEGHGELDGVEAIDPEIADEIIVFCYLIRIDAEMFGARSANIPHRFPTFFSKDRSGALFYVLHKSIKSSRRGRGHPPDTGRMI